MLVGLHGRRKTRSRRHRVALRVYHYNFVLEYEETGRFRIGEDIRLIVCVIKNVAAAAEVRRLNGGDYATTIEGDKDGN